MWIAVGPSGLKPIGGGRTRGILVRALGILLLGTATIPAAEALAPAQAARMSLLEAVRSTLKRDPNIQIQEEEVKISRGAVQREEGAFDFTLDGAISQGTVRTPRTELERLTVNSNLTSVATDITNQRLGVTRQFRAGPSVSTGLELNRLYDNLGKNTVNRANVNFIINVPLMKRFGRDSTGASERAARIIEEAAALELRFVMGQRTLNTATAFWECLGAEANLQILRQSAARSSNLLTRVNQLVEAGEIPKADLRQTEADVAQKTAELKGAEQRFVQARQNFGLAIGLGSTDLLEPPLPEMGWPEIQTNDVPAFTGQQIIERSLIRRADFQAARKSQEAATVLERGARLDLKPQLDLTLEAGYAGLSEGSQFQRFYTSIDPRVVDGPNAIGTLRFLYPLGNRSAKGLLAQREAQTRQAGLREQNLARGIGSAIMVAFSDLEQSSQEVARAREAVTLYRMTVANERDKLQLGISTIVDVITIADRLDSAEIRATDATVRYASALARIRYETGLLPVTLGDQARFSLDDLITLPKQSDLEAVLYPPAKKAPSP